MKCALAAIGFINEDIDHNKAVMIDALMKCAGKADIVILGEAFLQGFDGVHFSVEQDKFIAIEKDDQIIHDICLTARENMIGVSFGFIERESDRFYSSQITIDKKGKIIDLFRRVSPGWKKPFACVEYCEGNGFHTFDFMGKKISVGLCGDLWYEENINSLNLLKPDMVWWPVYTDYHAMEWNTTIKYEYAEQAGKINAPVLYVNSLCIGKAEEHAIAKGGACSFANGVIVQEIASGFEGILVVEQ